MLNHRCWTLLAFVFLGMTSASCLSGSEPPSSRDIARCEVTPLADHQVAFSIDGVEKMRWNYGERYPRPFFFPFYGPSGSMLTRMGHPGAPDHDHHQSIWFAHNKVNELNFWGNGEQTQVRQKQWLCYQDGNDEAVMAVQLGWFGPDGKEVMEQELVAALLPITTGDDPQLWEHGLELQFTLKPGADVDSVELAQTNFGFLAVRVAKSISASFGGGGLSNSEGGQGEAECFGKPARWMDYSGPVAVGQGGQRKTTIEGVTFFDHPHNPRAPTHWHVRQDGWMGAAYGLSQPAKLTPQQSLTLRYFLHAHHGPYDAASAERVAEQFANRSPFVVSKGTKPHFQYEVKR